jgi:hypothetical protein
VKVRVLGGALQKSGAVAGAVVRRAPSAGSVQRVWRGLDRAPTSKVDDLSTSEREEVGEFLIEANDNGAAYLRKADDGQVKRVFCDGGRECLDIDQKALHDFARSWDADVQIKFINAKKNIRQTAYDSDLIEGDENEIDNMVDDLPKTGEKGQVKGSIAEARNANYLIKTAENKNIKKIEAEPGNLDRKVIFETDANLNAEYIEIKGTSNELDRDGLFPVIGRAVDKDWSSVTTNTGEKKTLVISRLGKIRERSEIKKHLEAALETYYTKAGKNPPMDRIRVRNSLADPSETTEYEYELSELNYD